MVFPIVWNLATIVISYFKCVWRWLLRFLVECDVSSEIENAGVGQLLYGYGWARASQTLVPNVTTPVTDPEFLVTTRTMPVVVEIIVHELIEWVQNPVVTQDGPLFHRFHHRELSGNHQELA